MKQPDLRCFFMPGKVQFKKLFSFPILTIFSLSQAQTNVALSHFTKIAFFSSGNCIPTLPDLYMKLSLLDLKTNEM